MIVKNIYRVLLIPVLLALTHAIVLGRQAPCDVATVTPSQLRCAFNTIPNLPQPMTSGQVYISPTDKTNMPYATFLYPNQNTLPASHRASGDSIAASLQPLDANGNVDLVNGKIVVIAEGMSNAQQQMAAFEQRFLQSNPAINPRFQFANLAEGGCNLICWRDKGVGKIDPQVQIVFMKHSNNFSQLTDGTPRKPRAPFWTADDKRFPRHALLTLGMLKQRILDLKIQYPNLKMLYITSRTYGGWTCFPADAKNNREPVAYEEGFSTKWLIESQITRSDPAMDFRGPNAKAPWMMWGPYLWDSSWPQDWFEEHGTHPCARATRVIARIWFDFLMSDNTSRIWFRDNVPPTAPASLNAQVVNSSQIDLSWNVASDNSGFVKYEIFRDGAFLKVTPNTFYSDNGLNPATQYCYTVSAVDSAGNRSAGENKICAATLTTNIFDHSSQPLEFKLLQNYPNPFGRLAAGAETEIRFQLPEDSFVEVKIYNIKGEEIRTFTRVLFAAGNHLVRWDGKDRMGNDVVNGVYLYRLRAGRFSKVMKMTLLR